MSHRDSSKFAVLLAVCLLLLPFLTLAQATGTSDANANMQTSTAAARSEAVLGAGQVPGQRTLAADHWLNGTGTKEDTVPAFVAPKGGRRLIKEYGPAYLEQYGDTRVLHLKGTHYEMGYQHGMLLKDEIVIGAKLIEVVGMVSWEKNFKVSCREAWNRTSPHIPQKYKDEIAGMAEATGLPIETVQNFTIFPELFHCSGFAAWGKATADGSLLHGRVLDYMREVGLHKFALVIVEEPKDFNAFVNVGYSGTIGSVTCMNDKHVSFGEMGGGGAENWDGMPMTLLMREVMESASTLEQAMSIIQNTPRTCEYYYVLADSKADNGRGYGVGVASWPDKLVFIQPNQYHELLPRPLEDAVMLSAGDRYQTLVNRVEKMYGKITTEVGLDIMARGVAMTSNMHNALFKPATLEFWVANSTLEQPACNNPYTHYDLNELIQQRPGS